MNSLTGPNSQTQESNVPLGEYRIGKSRYTIDDVTDNAVIALRTPAAEGVAVMNFDPLDAPKSYDVIERFVKEYLRMFNTEDCISEKSIDAVVIGGLFTENRSTDEGIIIYVEHTSVKRDVETALKLLGVKAEYVPTELKTTKNVVVDKDGKVGFIQELRGLNKFDALKSKHDYEATIGKTHNY